MEEVFYSPEFNSQSLNKFVEFLRKKKPKHTFSHKQIKEFYDKQPVIQRTRMKRLRQNFNPIITLESNSILYMDTTFIKTDNIAVITALDLFSKKGYVRYVKTRKSRGGLDKGKSVKASDSVKFLDDIMEKTKYKEIRTDGGSEFQDTFKRKYGQINKQFVDVSKRLLSPVERFNRTVKQLYEKKKLLKKPANKIQFFQEIEDAYNNTTHRTIGHTPNEVFENPNLVIPKYKSMLNKASNNKYIPYPPDTKVRVYMPPNKFNKLKPNWSERIYVLDENSWNDEILRYIVNGKLYDPEDIQRVKNETEEITNNETKNNEEPIIKLKSTRLKKKPQLLNL